MMEVGRWEVECGRAMCVVGGLWVGYEVATMCQRGGGSGITGWGGCEIMIMRC